MKTKTSLSLFDPALLRPALWASVTKLSPRVQWRNPVMFIVYIGSILTTLLWVHSLSYPGETGMRFAAWQELVADPRSTNRLPLASIVKGCIG